MKLINKLAVRIGWWPVSIGLISLLSVIMLLIFGWQQSQAQQQLQAMSQQYQQQIFNTISSVTTNKVNFWQKRMESLAQQASSEKLLNDENIELWQEEQKQIFPQASKVCYFKQIPTAPNDNACIPIGFAALNAFRQLAENGQADIALIQTGEQAHVLLAQAVKDETGNPSAAILVALESSVIDDLVGDKFVSSGYLELLQGKNKTSVISRYGNPQFKQKTALFQQKIPGSYWQLHYWAEPQEGIAGGWFIIAVMIVFLILFWILQQLWLYMLLKHDADSLEQQLIDLEARRLKLKYPHAWSIFNHVADAIQRLGVVNGLNKNKAASIAPPTVELSEPAIVHEENILSDAEKTSPLMEMTSIQAEPKLAAEELDQSIFKAYDIRGIVNEQLDDGVMTQIGQAVGSEVLEQGLHKLVVGRDGRLSSASLAKAFIDGVLSSGCDIIDLGCVPTPLVYFACEHLDTHSGAVVTASHNPAEYNGLKVQIAGKTLTGDEIQNLYQRITMGKLRAGQGRVEQQDISQAYIERVKSDVKLTRNMNVVVDCGNGVAGNIVPQLLRELGCQVTELYCEVDGSFPHHHPDPSQPQNMQDLIQAVKSHEAELGLAFDGDGDRLGVVDAKGELIWPDRLLIMLAQHVLVEQPDATIIYDVKCTNLLEDVISRSGGQPVMSPSGYPIIKNKMTELDAKLAGELSGHIFFRDRWYGFDDALYSAARLLQFLAADPLERTPTEVFAALPKRVTTPEILHPMPDDESHKFIERLQRNAEFEYGNVTTIDGVRVDFPYGWGLVRASNTVPGLSLRFEASTEENLEQIKQVFIEQMLKIQPALTLIF